MTTSQEEGGEKPQTVILGKRTRGDVLGDMSFLLDTVPTATVAVADDYVSDVTVIEVQHSRAINMLKTDPKFAAKVFQMLAAVIAQRLAILSESKRTAALHAARHHHPQQQTGMIDDSDTGAHAAMEPSYFGLDDDAEFQMLVECTVLIEDRRERKKLVVLVALRRSHIHEPPLDVVWQEREALERDLKLEGVGEGRWVVEHGDVGHGDAGHLARHVSNALRT